MLALTRRVDGSITPRKEDLESGKIDPQVTLVMKTSVFLRAHEKVRGGRRTHKGTIEAAVLAALPSANVALSGRVLAVPTLPGLIPNEPAWSGADQNPPVASRAKGRGRLDPGSQWKEVTAKGEL